MDDNQEQKDLSRDEETLLDELGIVGAARRKFLGQSMAAALGTFAFHLLAKERGVLCHARRFARRRVRPERWGGKRR